MTHTGGVCLRWQVEAGAMGRFGVFVRFVDVAGRLLELANLKLSWQSRSSRDPLVVIAVEAGAARAGDADGRECKSCTLPWTKEQSHIAIESHIRLSSLKAPPLFAPMARRMLPGRPLLGARWQCAEVRIARRTYLVCSRIAAASRQQFEAAASNNRLALFAPDGCLHEPLR